MRLKTRVTLKDDSQLISTLAVITAQMALEGDITPEKLLGWLVSKNNAFNTLSCLYDDMHRIGDDEAIDINTAPDDVVSSYLDAVYFVMGKFLPHRNKLISHYSSLLSGAPKRKEEAIGAVEVDAIREDYMPFGEHSRLVGFYCDYDYGKGKVVFESWGLQDLMEAVIAKKNMEMRKAYELEVLIWSNTAPHAAKPAKPPKPPKLI